jgi:Raf kinase inhibitor-like YbhB/YbcL family protein
MKLLSAAFQHGGKIPSKHTCDGPNLSPPLRIEGVPAGTKSLALIMEDPDVPKSIRPDGMWDHWVVFDIPPDVQEIPEGQEPPGTPGLGTGGNTTYFGPCPPDREHRYFFKLYALDSLLRLPARSSKAKVEKAMEGHILARVELMGRYQRVKR